MSAQGSLTSGILSNSGSTRDAESQQNIAVRLDGYSRTSPSTTQFMNTNVARTQRDALRRLRGGKTYQKYVIPNRPLGMRG